MRQSAVGNGIIRTADSEVLGVTYHSKNALFLKLFPRTQEFECQLEIVPVYNDIFGASSLPIFCAYKHSYNEYKPPYLRVKSTISIGSISLTETICIVDGSTCV